MSEMKFDSARLNEAVGKFGIEANDFKLRREFVGFGEEDAKLLNSLVPLVEANAEAIVDGFYANVERYGNLQDLIQRVGSNVDRLKVTQKEYLISMFRGPFDADYMNSRLRIGVMHFNIGLGPRWYLGSYSVYFELLAQIVRKKWRFRPGKQAKVLSVINKVLSLDAQMAIDSYVLSLVSSIRDTVEDVHSGISNQATAATQQAAAVAQTSSSLQEIRESSDSTLERATEMNKTAEQSFAEGNVGMRHMVEGIESIQSIRQQMEDIAQNIIRLSEQTKKIGEITATVNNLSQQSKMLAINASIEAAKAGEAGRGFAVVAEEVGNLAEQSEEATVQVRQMLEDIQSSTEKSVMATEEGTKRVDHGVTLVQNAGSNMESLNHVIEQTSIASQQIVASVRQQAMGINQVTDAMNDINQVTNQFVTSSGQIKKAATDLLTHVDSLEIKGV